MIQKAVWPLSIIALFSSCIIQGHSNVTPTLVLRSQGFHANRQRNVGMANHINLYNTESQTEDDQSWYDTFDIGVGYSHSLRSTKLAHCLFGDDLLCNNRCKNTIKVQGSGVADRDAKAWLADYLYLNCDYDGSFSVNPRIQNVTIDLDLYVGFDHFLNGLYYRLYTPVCMTKWQTRFCTTDPATVTTTSCSTGYLTPSGSEQLLSSLEDYFSGSAPDSVDGIEFQSLRWGKMPSCDQKKWGVAELRTELGWNFLQRDGANLGIALHLGAPTGSKRHAAYVMYPMVGNGNHYEIGASVHGHYIFWRSKDEESHVGFYFDAVVTHMLKAREERTFDLYNKPNSRYMLATKFTTISPPLLNGLGGKSSAGVDNPISRTTSQFNNIYAPVANLTTTDIKVSVGVQADVVTMFHVTNHGFSWDIGYNFWGRSCEEFQCPTACNACDTDSIFDSSNITWGLKGDARMFGFAGADHFNVGIAQNDAIPLSTTQSAATIHSGTNSLTVDANLTSVTMQNGGVDNALFAVTGPDLQAIGGSASVRLIHTPTSEGGLNINTNQIKTSIQPIFIKSTDVALHETKGISHTAFTHFSYTWDRDHWMPYLGIGGSAEFGKSDCNTCSSSSCCSTSNSSSSCNNCCSYCSLSQWAIWVKGGLSFN